MALKTSLFVILERQQKPIKNKRGEIKLKTPLQRHIDNVGNQLKEEKQENMNSAKEYTVKIKVDTSELDCAIKKLKQINKLVKKIKAHQIV